MPIFRPFVGKWKQKNVQLHDAHRSYQSVRTRQLQMNDSKIINSWGCSSVYSHRKWKMTPSAPKNAYDDHWMDSMTHRFASKQYKFLWKQIVEYEVTMYNVGMNRFLSRWFGFIHLSYLDTLKTIPSAILIVIVKRNGRFCCKQERKLH